MNKLITSIGIVNKLNFEEKFVIIILPIINSLALVTTGFFKEKYSGINLGFNPGDLRGLLLLLFLGYFYLLKRVRNKLSFLINTLAALICLSTLYSVDFSHSFPIALKFFMWSSFFGLGYFYINSLHKFLIYTKVYIVSLLLIFVSLFFANIFDLGLGIYDSSYKAGAAGLSVVLLLSHVFFFIPFFQRLNKNKLFKVLGFILLGMSFIFIAISTKRGAIFGLILGYIVYIYYTPNRSSKVFLKIVPFIGITFIIISLLFNDLVYELYAERSVRYQLQYKENLEQEARYYEIINTTESAFSNLKNFLVGNGFFSETSELSEVYTGGRQYHIDYFSILHGTGFIGLGLYLYILYFAFKSFNKYKKLNNSYLSNELFAIVMGSLTCLSILAFSSTITSIDYRAYIYFFYGGILRIMKEENKELKQKKINEVKS
jgi:hypothetical protein